MTLKGHRLFAVLAFSFFLGASSAPLFATTFVNRPLGEVMRETDIIVRGRAGESYADWDKSGRKSIYTYTPLTVSEVLKGEVKESRILLRQPGGSKDGMEMNVPGAANFDSDEDVVVLLGNRNSEDGSYDVPGFATGKYEVVTGENGEPALVNSLGGAAMYDPGKDPRTLSYNSKIPLEVFRRVAKGEDIPEAAHRQYERSQKPAAKGSYEADHPHHKHTPSPKSERGHEQPAPVASVQPESVQTKNPYWVPLSFAALAAALGLALWFLLRSRGGN
ncbi:MAG: hypothetical protein AB1540_13705 [Bdellovibrionota bacterium]